MAESVKLLCPHHVAAQPRGISPVRGVNFLNFGYPATGKFAPRRKGGEMVLESMTLRALTTLATLAPRCTSDRSVDAGKVKVAGYCCPVPRVLAGEKVEGFCCPVPSEPLESPSVARRGPTALLSL